MAAVLGEGGVDVRRSWRSRFPRPLPLPNRRRDAYVQLMRSKWRFTPVVGILVAALGCGGGDDAAVVDGTIGEATNGDVTTAELTDGTTELALPAAPRT